VAIRNTVRIVGGDWRGRRLRFPDIAGLRPTPDRVRETLFNWLAPVIRGTRCLDLFAGSGALGFEALSRGAAALTLVERDRNAAQALRIAASELKAGPRAEIVERSAAAYLESAPAPYDVVFLDPPFDGHAVPATVATLVSRRLLRPGGYLYIEVPVAEALPPLPPGWRLHRSGRAGLVGYHLIVCSDATSDGEDTGDVASGAERKPA
jgi:16S rRNA (guanine966-N2)-methyltransferase